MKYLLAGGGTAGHVNPALAIAGYIKEKEPDAEILFVGTPDGMEARLVKAQGYAYAPIEVAGFQRKPSLLNIKRNIGAAAMLMTSGGKAKRILREFKPDIAIGTGGYVSGPIIRKAQQLGIKTFIHEQNAFPGVTTKMLSKRAKCIMLADGSAKKHLDGGLPIEVTGNPVRSEFTRIAKSDARSKLGLDERPVILSFGGSLGARRVNEAAAELIAATWSGGKYRYIHAYGQYGKWFPGLLKEKGVDIGADNLDVREYIDNMPECINAADIVICRAGGITLSELELTGKPSVLIPSPNVAENHQYHNAMSLVNKNAAKIIEEKNLTGALLTETVTALLEDKSVLNTMAENAKAMAIPDTLERIYKIIKA